MVFDGRSNADVFCAARRMAAIRWLQMKSRGSISGGIGRICFKASLKKIEGIRDVIYIRVLDVAMLEMSKPPPLPPPSGSNLRWGSLHRSTVN